MKTSILFALVLVPVLGLSACARAPEPTASSQADAMPKSQVVPATQGDSQVVALPLAVVHKSPTCGCCGLWVDHLRQAGFRVEVRNEEDLNPIKERLGVPYGKGACHTAEIGGYVVEGHVPAEDIKRLLSEKPDAKGLVLPGMPPGSPGMEVPDGTVHPYTVELVRRDGSSEPYASHGG